MSQQRACVFQGGSPQTVCTCCHTEIEVADQTFYLAQSQHTDNGPTSPNADPITPGAWQCSHWSGNFYVIGVTRLGRFPLRQRELNHDSAALDADAVTTRPTRRSYQHGLKREGVPQRKDGVNLLHYAASNDINDVSRLARTRVLA